MMIFITSGIGLLLAIFIIHVIRNVYQLPYPIEGVFGTSDTKGVTETLELAKKGTTLKWVMGTFNPLIFLHPSVENAFRGFLEREVKLIIIVGPNINAESESLVRDLIDRSHVMIRQLPYNPKRHFRIISNEHLCFEPREHKENELSAYILIKKAKAMLKQYERYFRKYERDSEILTMEDMDRIFHAN